MKLIIALAFILSTFNVSANNSTDNNLILWLEEAIENKEVSFLKKEFTGITKSTVGDIKVKAKKKSLWLVIKINF